MGKKKKGPGTAGPYGDKKYGEQKMQNFPTQVPTVGGLKWVVKNGFAQGIKGV